MNSRRGCVIPVDLIQSHRPKEEDDQCLGAQSGAFEGANASTFAIELGSHIRRLVPLHKETWAAIDDGCKEVILTAAAQKYDFGDWKTDARVAAVVGKLAMHIFREFRAELHKAYKKLLEKGHDPKQCPYDTQRVAQWVWLIENKWETPKWKIDWHRHLMDVIR